MIFHKAKKLIAICLTSIIMLGFGFGFSAQNVLADWTTGKFDAAMDFNGTGDFIFAGDLNENVKTVSFWIKADSTTEKIIDLDAGTHYIQVDTGALSAPGFAATPIYYIDGTATLTPTLDTNWHFVAITTDTAIDANAVYLGKVFIDPTEHFFDGVLDDIKFYDRVLTALEVAEHYRQRSPSIAQGGTISASSTSTLLEITQSGTGNIADFKSGASSILTVQDADRLRMRDATLFTFGDINEGIIDDMEAIADWAESDNGNTDVALEETIVKVNDGAMKITTTAGSSNTDTLTKTFATNQNYSVSDRIGFWIQATESGQILSIKIHDTDGTTSTDAITLDAANRWQYEEWDISGILEADRDTVDTIKFYIDDDTGSPTIYIDQLRYYDKDDRAGEIFIDGDGHLVLAGEKGIEFQANIVSSLPGLRIDAAIVEVNQPFAVNVAGDTGINYDLTFLNTGTTFITSAGPLVIAAGDPNHSENLTITTGGSGDVIVDIVDSTFGFKVLGVQGGYVFRILPSGDLDIHSVASNLNTPFGGFGQYQNLLTYSEELENVAWTKTTLTTATNSVAAPDGQNTADTLTSTSDDGDIEQDYDTNADVTDRSFIFSVWLRAASAVTSRLKIISSDNGINDGTTLVSETRPVTIEWQRFYVKGTFGTVTDDYVKAQIVPVDGSTGAVYAWGAQLEEASDAGVYAYTTSSVVAADEGLLAKDLKLSGDLTSDGTLTAGGSGTSYIYDSLNIGTDTTAGTVDMGTGADADLFVSDDLEIEGGLFVEGETTFTPSTAQVIGAVGDTILANATVIVLNPDGDYTMTSAPTIADGITGQVLYITCANGEANTVTVQDQDTLASSNLQLGDTTRAISGKDVLQLMFDGTNWIEVSFANN